MRHAQEIHMEERRCAMRRANAIQDAELKSFCEWYLQRFKANPTNVRWFAVSLEGAMKCPHRDVKDLLKRMQASGMIKCYRDVVEIFKVKED